MRKNKFCIFVIILLCFVLFSYSSVECSKNEYYSSISGLEKLLEQEYILLQETEDYIEDLSIHLDNLRSDMDVIKREHQIASKDRDSYLNNPVSAYRLIKRLHNDWPAIEQNVRNESSSTKFLDAMERHKKNFNFPTQNDAAGAAVALVRLQDTYQLDVDQVANGILNGVKYGSEMSWQDCFHLSQYLYIMQDFNHTIPWLKQSVNMLSEVEYGEDPIYLDFMEVIVTYFEELGEFEGALNVVNHITTVDPKRWESLLPTKLHLEEMITNGVKQGLKYEVTRSPEDYHLTDEFKLYEKVCRGEVALTPTEQRSLHCILDANGVAYRLLQPFKMEIHHWDPYIVQFHDVVREKAVAAVKRLAKPKMSRSEIRTVDGLDATVSWVRTSKSAWFNYTGNRYMMEMLTTLQDFSGLNASFAEELQVANYGIGGHYEPHWDFFTKEHEFSVEDGNRVATGIYYLSDVEEGGATSFPFLHVRVKPVKGSALFWYNLHSSEDPDYRTKHAACPVLKGSKWIANIWLRVRGQFSARPCGLHREHELSLMYKDRD